MKAGIFTFHFAKNYGAMLQAYALCMAVRNLSVDCEIVDYRYPWMYRGEGRIRLREHYALHRLRDNRLVSALKALRRWILGFLRHESHQDSLYRDFFERHLPLSARVRDEDLSQLGYDVLLCGSDQIWNARITGRLASPYFLAFDTPPKCRKIAYAASCGSGTFQEQDATIAAKWIAGLNAVGVRERKLAETIRYLLPDSHPEVVLDPTFLIKAEKWQTLARPPKTDIPTQFLLLYIVEETPNSAWIYDKVREYATEKHLPIVKLVRPCDDDSAMPRDMGIVGIEDCGPLEFLWLFSHASAIFAGSFHASVFSILFQRDFFCIPHPTDRERTDSLLDEFGISARTLETDTSPLAAPSINWESVEHRLEIRRMESVGFLKKALRDAK